MNNESFGVENAPSNEMNLSERTDAAEAKKHHK